MAPIHSAVTRRHFLKAFGVAAVALALPAQKPARKTLTVLPDGWHVTLNPPTNGWFEGCPISVGDTIQIEGVWNPHRVFRVTHIASDGTVLRDWRAATLTVAEERAS